MATGHVSVRSVVSPRPNVLYPITADKNNAIIYSEFENGRNWFKARENACELITIGQLWFGF